MTETGNGLVARFEGKRAVVTGGGAGIGRATAVRLAAEGARVGVVDIDGDAAGRTAAVIGGAAVAIQADITDVDSLASMVEQVADAFGGIDVLHANAGVPQRPVRFEDISLESWRHVIDVNLTGAFLTTQAVVPVMRRQGHGSIVISSSMASVRVRDGMAAYVSSKAGVNGLVKALALELAPIPVRVNAVLPSAVLTDMLRSMAYGDDVEASIRSVSNALPLGGPLEPEDLAAAVAFLASDEARYITGALLNVDAGRSL